MSLSGSISEI